MIVRATSRSRLLLPFLLALVLWPASALAWIETVVRSHQARVTVAADGSAEVRHELVVKLRGGPLETLDVAGVGTAIELSPDASVSRADQGSGLLSPLELTADAEGDLHLKVLLERGLRGGSYLFKFGYRVSLTQSGWLGKEGEHYRLSFVGPRLPSGVDAAQVVFVVPKGEAEPRLPEQARGPAAGILLNQVRRGADTDEVELVRAHVASGEPALWEILVDRSALQLGPTTGTSPELLGPVPVVERALSRRGLSAWLVLAALAAGLFYGGLAWLKGRMAVGAATARGASVRALLPGSATLRAVVAGAAAGSAVLLGLLHQPTSAALAACLALLVTTHLLPVRRTSPRGPGSWLELDPAQMPELPSLPGRLFEPGHLRGFAFFAGLWLVTLGGAYRLLSLSTYYALMTALGALLFVPLFWTGRQADLPQPAWAQGTRWLAYLSKKLDSRLVRVELWGRVPEALGAECETAPDEVRVRIVPLAPRAGLKALEVALEEGPGSFVMPCLIVRVLEDSEAHQHMPPDLGWVRGLRPEEKVAVVRPAVPTPRELLRLARTLSALLTRSGERPAQPASKRPRPTSARAAAGFDAGLNGLATEAIALE